MREYKFRGKREDANVWVYGYVFKTRKANPFFDETTWIFNEDGKFKVEPETVGQYITIDDKNGVEIYEGDVVKSGGTMVFSNPNVPKDRIMIVKKLSSGFTLVVNNDFKQPNIVSNISNYTLWNTQRDWTIIGNTYDNPELLMKDA